MSKEPDRVLEFSDFGEARIKHLELIQAVISRLGTNGFLVKGWAITAAGIFLGFAVDRASWELAVVSLMPTFGFWGLDAYFLRCERLFRHLYNRVRVGDDSIAPFYMSATGQTFVGRAPRKASSWLTAFGRPAMSLFYGSIVSATILVVFLILAGVRATPGGSILAPPSPAAASVSPSMSASPSPTVTSAPSGPIPTPSSSP